MRRRLVVGNWQQSGNVKHCEAFLPAFTQLWQGVHATEVCICPAFPYLERVGKAIEHSNIVLGAQTLHIAQSYPTAGNVNATMLADVGCKYVIIGQSETGQGSTNVEPQDYDLIANKYKAAREKGLTPIVCIGETLQQYKQSKTFDVIGRQLLRLANHCGLDGIAKGVIAYQPNWANSANTLPSLEFIQDVHSYIREVMGPEGEQVRIIYCGDILDAEASDLFAKKDVDGILVGETSLNINRFIQICRAADLP